MAESSASEKSEAPTPERLRKARQEGRVPQSQEVPSAIVLGMFAVVLALAAPSLYSWLRTMIQEAVAFDVGDTVNQAYFIDIMRTKALSATVALMPFLVGGAAASIFASVVSSGWSFSAKAVKFDLQRISPVRGFKNLLSLRSLVHLLVSLAKLTVIVAIIYAYLRDKQETVLALRWTDIEGTLIGTGEIVLGTLGRIAVGLAAIAAVDLLYQRWNYKKDLKMTLQEVKEERKQYEVSPEIKGRMRAIQVEMAKKRMLEEVPNADVVLANPTHYAVAIRYDNATMDAPTVVAKGPDLLAQQIKKLARESGVPVVHRPELARAVYNAVDLGKTIPETLFVAVAEVLAMIYRTRKQRQGGG